MLKILFGSCLVIFLTITFTSGWASDSDLLSEWARKSEKYLTQIWQKAPSKEDVWAKATSQEAIDTLKTVATAGAVWAGASSVLGNVEKTWHNSELRRLETLRMAEEARHHHEMERQNALYLRFVGTLCLTGMGTATTIVLMRKLGNSSPLALAAVSGGSILFLGIKAKQTYRELHPQLSSSASTAK